MKDYLTRLKITLAILWNFRTIWSVLEFKTFPGVLDAARLRIWLLDRCAKLAVLARQLTPNWDWDDAFFEEAQHQIADDQSWSAIFWTIANGIVPFFSRATRQQFVAQLGPDMVAKCHECGSGNSKPFREGNASTSPVVVASVLSIFVSLLRIAQYLSGGKVEVSDTGNENDGLIPGVDGVVLPA